MVGSNRREYKEEEGNKKSEMSSSHWPEEYRHSRRNGPDADAIQRDAAGGTRRRKRGPFDVICIVI